MNQLLCPSRRSARVLAASARPDMRGPGANSEFNSDFLPSLARLLTQNTTTAFSIACTNETRTFVLTAFYFCVSVTVCLLLILLSFLEDVSASTELLWMIMF
jgi:hypothetical protein